MQRRELVTVGLLTFVTCGLYAFYWQYQTTLELKTVTGKTELNPALETLLTLVTCGLFGIYVRYRNAQLITAQLRALRGAHDDKSMVVLLLDLASLFTAVTFFIAVILEQDELNTLAEAQSGVALVSSQPVP